VGAGTIGYLQQPLPSQQAGFPQQEATVAALADNEKKRNAANANTSALSFMKMISFEKWFVRRAAWCAALKKHRNEML
jgi:hypothetical protein